MYARRILAFWIAVQGVTSSLLQVKTLNGTIQGMQCPYSGASQFLGIPFAEPPVGDLRFAPPQPYTKSFNGILQATQPAVNCIQFGTDFVETSPGSSEDCLYLDVWVPPNVSTTSKLPVKVWVYGGSGTAGSISEPLYNGCNLATDSVVVSMNYRLGAFGWFALETADLYGNYGAADIIQALEWVQENIAAFGGDPQKVVVFGQSEGADLAWMISTTPRAPSLMKAVISESGGGADYPLTNSTAIQTGGASLAKSLGCSVDDAACLRAVPANIFNASFSSGGSSTLGVNNNGNDTSSQPCVDGKIIPAQPSEVGSQVPAIFGSNTEEGTLFVVGYYTIEGINITTKEYTDYLVDNFGPQIGAKLNQSYPASLFNSTSLPGFYAMSSVLTNYAFTCTAHRALLKQAAKGIPAWTYLFDQAPTCEWISFADSDNPEYLSLLGATHTSEIPYVFNNINNLPLPNGHCNFSSADQDISALLVSAWTSMAEYGNPNAGGSISWPVFDANTSQGLLIGGNTTSIGYVDYTLCTELWDPIDAEIFAYSADFNPAYSSANGTVTGTANGTSGSTSGAITVKVSGSMYLFVSIAMAALTSFVL